MKIAIVHNLPSGGGKRALYEFSRHLHAGGHALDVYQLSQANDQFLPLAPFAHRFVKVDFPAFRLWQTRLLPFLLQYLNLPRKLTYLHRLDACYARLARQIDQHHYDVAFVHHCQVVQSPYILRHLQTPSVYYCQEPPRRLYEPPLERRTRLTLKQRIQRRWYAPAYAIYQRIVKRDDYHNARAATLLLANSYYSRESLYRVYGINARVNYLAVDLDKFTYHDGLDRENLVMSVGRSYPEKGYAFLIQALAQIPETIRPRFLIVADMRDPDEERYFLQIAERQNVDVTITSAISSKELTALVDWYRKAKLLVYAPIMEPFGLAPLEAMACGLPVVAVKEGGVRESLVHEQTGLLTQRDPIEFAASVQRLLEQPDLREQYGRQARQHVERCWTWKRATRELLENFERSRSSSPRCRIL